jgi:hypothetical protein
VPWGDTSTYVLRHNRGAPETSALGPGYAQLSWRAFTVFMSGHRMLPVTLKAPSCTSSSLKEGENHFTEFRNINVVSSEIGFPLLSIISR